MDSVNASSAVSGNSPSFACNAASALANEAGDQADLFSAILSQAQVPPPQAQTPDPANTNIPPPQQTAQQVPPAPPTQQPPQNNAPSFANNNKSNTDGTNSADANDPNNPSGANRPDQSNNNSGATNNTANANGTSNANASNSASDAGNDPNNGPNNANANASSSAAAQTASADESLAGKSSQRHSKTDASNTNAKATGNTHNKSKSKSTVTAAGTNQTANIVTPNSATIDAVSSIGGQDGANANTDPATDTNAEPSTPGPAANANTPSPDTAPAANSDPAINAGLILNADPKTGSTTPAAGNDNNTDPATTSANDPANNGVMPSQLMMLLMQLEHFAANQASTQTASANLVAANGGQTSNTGSTQQTTASSGDQGKIDLKALMAAIAKIDDGNADLNSNDGTTASSNTTPSSSATNSSQNTAPASGNTSSNTDPKWINPDFLNLFSLSANNPAINPNAQAQTPILFNTGILTGTTTGGDGTSLNSDTQGQTNTGVQDNAVLSNTNSMPPSALPTQGASPYDFASELSALRATQGGSTGLPPAIDQVILQLSRNLNSSGSSQMSIQLRPAELGRVDVKLTIGSDGKVEGTVTADNSSTLNLLLKDVRGLERALQEAGLRADSGSLQFGLRGDGQSGGNSGQTAGDSSAPADDSASMAGASTTLPGFAGPAETYYLTPGGVNMRV